MVIDNPIYLSVIKLLRGDKIFYNIEIAFLL